MVTREARVGLAFGGALRLRAVRAELQAYGQLVAPAIQACVIAS